MWCTPRPRHWPTAPPIPPTEWFTRNIRRSGFEVPVDLAPVEEVADRLRYIAKREDKPLGDIVEYDAFHYEHQMPGGMISNLKSQLTPLGIGHRLPEVLEEAARVRCDLGYPIIVSPFAQFVMTQAVLNVMGKERYATVPDEVRKYVLGYYGEIAGPIDPNLFDRITKGAEPTTARPGDLLEPGIREAPARARPVRFGRRSAAGGVLSAHANTTRSRPPARSRPTIRSLPRRSPPCSRRSRCDATFARSTSSNGREP